jgi:hypothetical protein
LRGVFYDLEDGDNTFLRNVGEHIPDYTKSHPRRFFIVTAVRISNPTKPSIDLKITPFRKNKCWLSYFPYVLATHAVGIAVTPQIQERWCELNNQYMEVAV